MYLLIGIPVVRFADQISPHPCFDCGPKCDGICPAHSSEYLGSHNAYANGKSIQAIGDITTCTSTAIFGSSDVTVG